ncbi:MAG TPA: PPOX class F420-dependent oxidoreductase [Acidimicrobiales bacterium]|nr:PPOX class F420-dependent oxidoreductase [Acidimicrobiales bacterium]
MDVDEARAFLGTHHRAVMVAFRSNGRPQTSPVVCGLDEAGRVVVSSRETAMKVKNLRRDPRVSLCVMDDRFFGKWIQVDGHADVVSLPEAMEGLVDYYRTVVGEHPDWDDYRAAMERERRVLVRFEIERAGPDRQG